ADSRTATRSPTMIAAPATARPAIRTTTSSQTGSGRGRTAARLMSGYVYNNPSSAARPASSIQTTRAMARATRNRHMRGRLEAEQLLDVVPLGLDGDHRGEAEQQHRPDHGPRPTAAAQDSRRHRERVG